MNKQDLDALANLYEEVYYPQDVEQLDEIAVPPKDSAAARAQSAAASRNIGRIARGSLNALRDLPAATMSQLQGQGAVASNDAALKRQQIRGQNLGKLLSGKLDQKPPIKPQRQGPLVPSRIANASNSARPQSTTLASTSSNPVTRTAIERPSTVLAKQKGVEGKLDKATGKFTAGAFSGAEKSRYASVAAQNAARNSASSAPKPPTPAVGKLGNTSFERRTPTSAELRAAQSARASGASPEKALQAAQKTNLPTQGPTPAIPDLKSVNADLAKANSPAIINKPAPAGTALASQQAQQKKPPTPGTGALKPMTQKSSYEWPSAKTIKDIADAYSSIYEAKKKVDQDQDGDNDFADVRIARMVASGVPKAKAIAMVKDKSYNEEVELWVNELLEEGYDLSEYTWEDMFEIYLDEATRMRKELGKEGEIATRQELARRSNAYQRSGSVDRTIAAAERRAKNPYVVRGKNETEADYSKRKQKKTETLTRLASNRRGSVRDNPRAGLRGYAAKVEGSDRDLQSARSSAMAAGTLTPRERKQLNIEAYEAYEFVASYLLENNFASRIEDANVIINNMSEGWFESIMEEKKPLPVKRMAKQARRIAFSQGVEDASDEGSSGYVSHSNPDRALKRMGKVGGPKVQHHIKKGYEMGTEHDPYYGRGKK